MRSLLSHFSRSLRTGGLYVALLGSAPGLAAAQVVDTLVVQDSLAIELPDSLVPGVSVVALDSGMVVDTVHTTHPDSVFRTLPKVGGGASPLREAGVTVWDQAALLGSPALTLLELLAWEPDLLPLRYGDHGAPQAIVGAGAAGGRVRLFVDGVEAIPLTSSVPDLGQWSLTAIEQVRVERAAGEVRIHITSIEPYDPRPLSRVEAATGDLDTNFFRGVFLHPRALGGTLGLSLERIDTRGRGGAEPGSRQGMWLRYALHRGDDLALAFDYRKNTGTTELDSIPTTVDRTLWTLRARAALARGLTAELYTSSGSVAGEDDGLTPIDLTRRQHGARLSFERTLGAVPAPIPGPDPLPFGAETEAPRAALDDLTGEPIAPAPRPDSAAARDSVAAPDSLAPDPLVRAEPGAGLDAGAGGGSPLAPTPVAVTVTAPGRLWADAAARLHTGPDLPARTVDFGAGLEWRGVGGVAADLRTDRWADAIRDEATSARGVRGWTAPLLGLSLFGGWDAGVRGGSLHDPRQLVPEPDTLADPDTIPAPDPVAAFHLSDRTALHAGARFALGPVDVTGQWMRVDVDSILPAGLLGARAGVAVAGDVVTGFQLSGRVGLPLLVDGLAVTGSLRQWESGGVYRPRRRYTAGLDFHNVYKAGNLEFWASAQVQGRDPMLLPRFLDGGEGAAPVVVPFQQSWDLWLQVRVLTVRIFIRAENVGLRPENQDFPGRLLPQTRSIYGIRWTLWN